jgi:hypothetical protein
VKRAARVAALEALLARVQANASARREPREPIDDAETPLGPRVDVAHPAATVARGRPAPPAPPAEPVDLAPWSSIMERELRDPSPPSVPPPPAPMVPPPLSSPRRPSVPPPVEVEPAAPIAAREVAAAPVSVRPPFDSAPESELQRAIREASLAGPPVMEPAAVWNEAASDLRERRSNPPPPAAPVATPPPAAAPAPAPAPALASTMESAPTPATAKLKPRRTASRPRIQAVTASTPAGPRVSKPTPTPTPPAALPVAPLIVHQDEAAEDEVPRLRRARRPGASRRGAAITVVGALIVVVGSLTWAIVERSGAGPVTPRAAPTAGPVRSIAAPGRPAPPPAIVTAEAPSVAPPGSASPPGSVTPPAPPSAVNGMASAAPAPALRNPAENGLLRIDHPDTVELYLQGVRTGTTNQWLEVACGPKNVRLARPGAPPPGHSFPMWLGEASTLHVRCGEVHAIRWTRE